MNLDFQEHSDDNISKSHLLQHWTASLITLSLSSSSQSHSSPRTPIQDNLARGPLPACHSLCSRYRVRAELAVSFPLEAVAATFQIQVSFQITGFKLLFPSTSAPEPPALSEFIHTTSLTNQKTYTRAFMLITISHYKIFLSYSTKKYHQYFTQHLCMSYNLFRLTWPKSSIFSFVIKLETPAGCSPTSVI